MATWTGKKLSIYSWNVNGIRAVERKGDLEHFLKTQDPDILFMQETKALPEQLSENLTQNESYYQYYHAAEKKGYSGVSVWAKKDLFDSEPKIERGMPGFEDTEGRVIHLKYQDISLLGAYFPNGGKSKEAWLGKIEFYKLFLKYVNKLRKAGQNVIWTGDLNVAHNEIDLARPKQNRKTIGFLPEEREWVDQVVADNWVDYFRLQHPEKVSYTYWDMPSRARERNVGWRIDYFFIDKSWQSHVEDAGHINDQMGSDHCPIYIRAKF